MLAMLKHRLILGTVMVAALLGLLTCDAILDDFVISDTFLQHLFPGKTYLPRGLILMFCFVILAALATTELLHIFRAKGIEASHRIIALSAITGCVFMYAIPSKLDAQQAVAVLASLMVLIFMAALIRHSYFSKRTQGAVGAAGAAAFCFIYMGVLPGFYLGIRRWHDVWVIAAIILITKSCDIGAYFSGRAFGKHKLIPWLSPGKTWEGLIGGACFSTLLAVGLVSLSNHLELSGVYRMTEQGSVFHAKNYPLWGAALSGLLLGVIGQAGDLVASLFKRDAGIKDSGKSIPGFGGLLDVIDSPIVTAPFAYWMLRLMLG